MDTEDLMLYVADTLKESEKYGLECEVLVWALRHLSNDDKKILEALEHGLGEWIK